MSDSEHRSLWRILADFVTKDRVRKIIALIFAIGFYAIISGTTGNEQTFSKVPVELELPEQLVNMDSTPPMFSKVIVRGSDTVLKHMVPSDLKVKVQIKQENYKSGTPYTIKIAANDIKSPFGTSVIAVEPQMFDLTLEARSSKKVPVEPAFFGMEAMNKDYKVSKVSFSPAEVTVSGNESLLMDIKNVATEAIPLGANATESFEYTVGLSPRSGVSLSPAIVSCFVEIVKENETKTIEAVPLSLLLSPGLEEQFKVELLSASSVAVSLYGPRGKLALFQEKTLRAFADLTALTAAGTYTVDVYCLNPADAELKINILQPKQVQLKLTSK